MIPGYITDDIEISSESGREDFVEENSNEENSNEVSSNEKNQNMDIKKYYIKQEITAESLKATDKILIY